MILPLVIASCGISVVTLILLIIFRPKPNNNLFALSYKLDDLLKKLDGISIHLKEDFRLNREELTQSAAANRQELSIALHQFKGEMTDTLKLMTDTNRTFSENIHRTLEEKITALIQKTDVNNQSNRETITTALKDFSLEQSAKLEALKAAQREQSMQTTLELEKINRKVEEKLQQLNEQAKNDQHLARQTMDTSFKGFNETFDKNVGSFNQVLREKFGQLEDKQRLLVESTEKKLEGIRETVDEKLQKTLNERLGQSFELVRQQLESVQKGLGEMQTLAQDVGGLKKVLSNVKMRGGFGEVQLHMLLENILAPEQYEANVATKQGSSERVEFAIKFPNKEGERDFVWLPIDAKFPKDAYETLQNAHDTGDTAAIEAAQRTLEATVKRMAKDICDKYLDAPHTTNFGILFLPFEGLFAEVVRKASLLEEIQRDCHVIITGPTTLAVILNSLQMGFRTLAIQKRSAEVWQVLGSVKKEFGQFGGLLQKAQNNIQTGLNQLDNVMGVRTRAIQRQLKEVEVLASDEEDQQLIEE
ncbi:DNA recombination protein RmuC [Flavisolibacter tropicus]|uniref:DNA recombination protein RmuC n=1 Tax=Flavisolibacter tropicus TaxID=1492898 RepID=UPI000B12615A|nr:DNA recombination protein RmuC [Flavisolibacter tropicus]